LGTAERRSILKKEEMNVTDSTTNFLILGEKDCLLYYTNPQQRTMHRHLAQTLFGYCPPWSEMTFINMEYGASTYFRATLLDRRR
jgi:hypothetical protein